MAKFANRYAIATTAVLLQLFLSVSSFSASTAFHSIHTGGTQPAFQRALRHPISPSKIAVSISSDQFTIAQFEDSNDDLKEQTKKIKQSKKPSFLHAVTTAQEFKKLVTDEKEKIVVVRFYAEWCKKCKAMSPYFYRMAEKQGRSVLFVEVAHTKENDALFKQLGVPGVPYGHIYDPMFGLAIKMPMLKKSDADTFENELKSIRRSHELC